LNSVHLPELCGILSHSLTHTHTHTRARARTHARTK